jgi:valyl-tRNA synthetase
MKFIGKEPFADVFITGTILDPQGQRMSKTKMNGVDPLDVFDKFGVDATRLTLAQVGSTDTRWNEKQVESYRNFANKIWNAARFCLLNSEGPRVETENTNLELHDRWILSRLNRTAREVNAAIDAYEFHAAVQTLYHFFWDDFCDWYIELTKADVTADEDTARRREARSRLLSVLDQALRLLHPFMPYITEELWLRLPGDKQLHPAYQGAEPTIMLSAYPKGDQSLIDEAAEAEMKEIIDLVSRVRNIRSEMNIKPSDRVQIVVQPGNGNTQELITAAKEQILRLTRAADLTFGEAPKASARSVLSGGAELAIPLEGLIDFEQERQRLNREQQKLQVEAAKLEAQLGNPNFVERAPAERVNEVRARIADIAQRSSQLRQTVENLQ